MVTSLLELPPEILIDVFSSLSLQDLLSFSETSHYARFLTNANLHTLALDFCSPLRPQRPKSYTLARQLHSTKPTLQSQRSLQAALHISKHLSKQPPEHKHNPPPANPHQASIHIPSASTHTYQTLTTFQSALTASILTRHAIGLRTLDLSIWALTIPIAKALAELTALQHLSITIAKCPYVRLVPRSYVLDEKNEERKAWGILARSEAGFPRLRSLKIVDAEVDKECLVDILRGSACRSLSLSRCTFIGRDMWGFMGREWWGWRKLEGLCLDECGGILDDRTLESLSLMTRLKHLDLSGCIGLTCEQVKEWNERTRRIKSLIPPRGGAHYEEEIIEVDPAYM